MKSYSLTTSKNEPIDFLLDKIFNKENGVFIELGGYDGLMQSNTAFFEFYRNWTGIVIEPSSKFNDCVKNRPKSTCFNAACVSNDYSADTIKIDSDNGPMTSIDGLRTNRRGTTEIRASTLSKIIDSTEFKEIDFLSLDAEGYEYEILNGLDLSKHRPKYMLIEIYTKDLTKITDFLLKNNYELVMNLTNYNKVDNPIWDGTHNDFLFKSS
jgi:FkbM family methyltransferase